MDGQNNLPLEGVRVLAIDRVLAGPSAGLILSDLGAEVINIEEPDRGDPYRNANSVTGEAVFATVNRNRGSIGIDLKSQNGKDIFFSLVEESDVVLENLGAGIPEKLGIGYEAVSDVNDDIVYCSIKGFFDGEYSDRKALDAVAQAMSGIMMMTGETQEQPMRAGTSILDIGAGMFGAIAVVAALTNPSGERGQKIESGLFETGVSFVNYWLTSFGISGENPEPLGTGHPLWTPYTTFEDRNSDSFFIGITNDKEWTAFCQTFGFTSLDIEAYNTNEKRLASKGEITEQLQERFSKRAREEIVTELIDLGIATGKVNSIGDVYNDPHMRGENLFCDVETDKGTEGVQTPLTPIRTTKYSPENRRDPPELGEDTEAILTELGYTEKEVEDLRGQEVIK